MKQLEKNRLIGQVEMYSMPHGMLPNREVDKPIGVMEFTLPLNKKFNTIDSCLKEELAKYMGTVKSATASTTPVATGSLRIGSVYKVGVGALTHNSVLYPVDSIFVAGAKTFTTSASGVCYLVYDCYDMAVNLFSADGALGAGDDGDGGIAFSSLHLSEMEEKFVTTVNAIASTYTEWKGVMSVTTARTFNGWLHLGTNYIHSTLDFLVQYAYVTLSGQFVGDARDFIVYWKINT